MGHGLALNSYLILFYLKTSNVTSISIHCHMDHLADLQLRDTMCGSQKVSPHQGLFHYKPVEILQPGLYHLP